MKDATLKLSDFGDFLVGTFPPVKIDRLAVDGNHRLLFASIVGDAGLVKGIRAVLHSDKDTIAAVKKVKVRQRSANEYSAKTPEMVGKVEGGYATEFVRLQYGQAHAFIMSKSPHFLMDASPERAWAILNDGNRFTTPLLPEWTPWIVEQMKAGGYLAEAYCHRCDCALINCSDDALDSIVSRGLKEGYLAIPGYTPRKPVRAI